MILVFTVDKQIITRRDNEKVVRDSVNYLHVNFSFSEEWTGDKTAVFKSKSGIAYNVLVGSDGSCLVPWEVLKEEYFEVSAFCGDLITANVVKVFTIPSGYEIGSQGRIPTPDIYAQIIARLSAIEAEIDPTAIQQVVDEYLSDKDYVTEQDVEQIVADYIEAHKDELKGEKGDTGATGPQGPQGIQGPKGDTGEGVAARGTTGQVLVKSSDADYDTGWRTFEGNKREKSYTDVALEIQENKYITVGSGAVSASNLFNLAEIPVSAGEVYRVVGTYNSWGALYALYDTNGRTVSTYPSSKSDLTITEGVDVVIPSNAVTMKISGHNSQEHILKAYKVTESNSYKPEPIHDALYGKKWFSCGDSFTAGDFASYVDSHGNLGENSDAFDPISGDWKTYQYYIRERTGIVYDNKHCAKPAVDFTNITGANQPFSSAESYPNYTMIPSDCDYITLQFGINERDLTAEQIGTSADTTNDTLWGAYNVVLSHILTNNPLAKIGIIISDAWLCDYPTYCNALAEIAEHWGIPYLDLSGGDNKVPMMISSRGDVLTTAKELRENAMAINYPNNQHPNPEGHKYRSTVIENFLRSL